MELVKSLSYAIEQAARAHGKLFYECEGDVADIEPPLVAAMHHLRVALNRAAAKPLWTETRDAK